MDEKEAALAEYHSLRTEILQNDLLIQRMSMFAFWAISAPLVAFAFKRSMPELLVLPPVAYFVYQQMMTHKLEGTIRIATYIARFIEPAIPGLAWETRIRKLKGGLPGIPTHVALMGLAVIGPSALASVFAKGPLLIVELAVAAFVLIYCSWQLARLKRLAGPEGFAASWSQIEG